MCFLRFFYNLSFLLLLQLRLLYRKILCRVYIRVIVLIMLGIFNCSLVVNQLMSSYRDISVASLKFLDDISQFIYGPYVNISAIFC
jgi:hypothetical protein